MSFTVTDTIRILGFQNADYNFLNLIKVSIDSDDIIQLLTKYKRLDSF